VPYLEHTAIHADKYIMNEDKDKDGVLEGGQRNTLDAMWYGPMGWISSLYLGALVAGKEMALEIGDEPFANECDFLIQKGRKNIVEKLFNGEYFIHQPDPNYPDAINTNDGCHIDQMLGQSFGWQVGVLERVIPEKECKSALESIWKYNFAPDAFLYQEQHKSIKGARTFATEGEAGTIMCTWPKGGDDKAVPGMDKRPEKSERWSGPGGYFDEVMNGFEYQVATHMVWEDLLEKGLATARAVHDRYSPSRRNPYNEIECSDHYSRSMASYGVLLAVCGFDYHGPKGHISFAPRINPEDFKAPFTAAQGWGSYSQKIEGDKLTANLQLDYGSLELASIGFSTKGQGVKSSKLLINGKSVNHSFQDGEKPLVRFDPTRLKTGDKVKIEVDLVR